jgi:RNA polymerase sigma-70 factor (ECF subfamily)
MAEDRSGPTVAELVSQHYELVYRVAYRLSGSAADAEDLTQQVFLAACAKSEQIRHPEAVRSWLLTILRHAYLRHRTRAAGRGWMSFESLPEPPAEVLNESDIDLEELQAALDGLPDEFRIPLILFYFEDLSYKEIAEQLESPIGTVMSRLSRARAYLRRRLTASQPATP